MNAYFDLKRIPYSTLPYLASAANNFYVTQFAYDSRGRNSQTITPNGTIYSSAYDGQGRTTGSFVGTVGSGAPFQVTQNEYDKGLVGDGNLTKVIQYNGVGSPPSYRTTVSWYDWRDRLVASKQGGSSGDEDNTTHRPIIFTVFDNLGEKTEIDQYDGDGLTLTSPYGVPLPPDPDFHRLRAKTVNAFDENGQLFQTQVFGVDSSSGLAAQYPLTTNIFYDLRGQVIAQNNPGGQVNKMTYDGAGRTVVSYVTDGAMGMSYGYAAGVTNDNVLEQTDTTFDNNGNAIMVIVRQRFDNDSVTGPLGNATTAPHARVYYTGYYFDAANRMIASVNLGTNGGNSWNRLTTSLNSLSRSNTAIMLTSQTYNPAGLPETVTDPRGIVSKTYYDALARTIQTITNYTNGVITNSSNQSTEFGYDGDNNKIFVQADLPAGGVEKTQYVYGVSPALGSLISSNDILYQVRYPDKVSGQPSLDPDQQVTYTVSALGQIITMKDRNGTVHSYI